MSKIQASTSLSLLAAAAVASLAFGAAAAPAFDESALKFAPDVKRAAEGFEPVPEPFVSVGGGALSAEPFYGSAPVGELRPGQRIEALAMTKGQGWLLVGRKGVGVGYVSRGVVCPERFCKPSA